MSALAVQAAVAAPASPVAASAVAGAEPDTGFAALLGRFADAAPATKDAKTGSTATKDAPDGPASGVMQTLEATLASLALYARPPAATLPTTSAPPEGATEATASPLESALAAATGALAGAWDLSGKTPLKDQLAADPSLGMTDFEIKTFLAAPGATPARTGAAPLGADSAWSPLDAVKLAATVAATTPSASRPTAAPDTASAERSNRMDSVTTAPTSAGQAEVPLRAVGPTLAPPVDGETSAISQPVAATTPATPATNAQAPFEDLVTAAAPQATALASRQASPPAARGPAQASSPRSHDGASSQPASAAASASPSDHGDAPAPASATTARRSHDDDATQPAAVSASTATVAADSLNPPAATVSLAQLPAFIASEAQSLEAEEPASTSATAADATAPKAAGAVKELQISLDPGDLGAMTLKLRLVGGKLSVTIAVANPQTLSAIENDRALIAARLATGSQALDDLVIQRQALPSSIQETRSSHASGSDNDRGDSDPEAEPDASPSNGRPPSRRSNGPGGAFRDLLV